jgi:hypothetical protein
MTERVKDQEVDEKELFCPHPTCKFKILARIDARYYPSERPRCPTHDKLLASRWDL